MTQVPFQAHDSQAGSQFDPIYQTDFVDNVEKSEQQVLQDLQKRNEQLFQVELADAKGFSRVMEGLAPFSQQLAQAARPMLEAHATRQDLKAQDKAHEWLKNNPDFLSRTVDLEEASINTDQAINEAVVDNADETGQIDLFAAREFRDIPEFKNHRFRKALLKEASKGYDSFYLQHSNTPVPIIDKDGNRVDRTLAETTDEGERRQIISRINRAWRRPFAGKDWDQAVVYKHLGKKMEAFESQEDQIFTQQQRTNFNTLKVESRYEVLADAFDSETPGVALQDYLINSKAKFSGYGKDAMKMARLQMTDDILTMVKEERYEDVRGVKEALFNTPLTWHDKSEMTFADKFPAEFERLDRAFAQAEAAEMQEIELKNKNKSNDFVASVYTLMDEKSKSDDPAEREFTNADIRGLAEQFRNENPGQPLPEVLSNIVTREERIDSADQEILEAIFDQEGIVYASDTAGMSFATEKWAKQKFGDAYVVDEGASVATQFSAMKGEANTQIDNMVSEHFMVTAGDMKDNEEIGEARRQAKASFSSIFWRHYRDPATAGWDDARIKAMGEIRQNLTDNKYALKLVPDNNTNVLKKRRNVYTMSSENPKSFKSTLIKESSVDIQALKAIQAGTSNDPIPSIYHYYAHLHPNLDIDAWDVADAQLKLYEKENGLPVKGLGRQPPLKQYVEGLTSPLEKRFLKSRPSYGRTTRVMVMQEGGDFNNPDLVIDKAL